MPSSTIKCTQIKAKQQSCPICLAYLLELNVAVKEICSDISPVQASWTKLTQKYHEKDQQDSGKTIHRISKHGRRRQQQGIAF